jgi:hypothetical protein
MNGRRTRTLLGLGALLGALGTGVVFGRMSVGERARPDAGGDVSTRTGSAGARASAERGGEKAGTRQSSATTSAVSVGVPGEARVAAQPTTLRWVAAGGGPAPESNPLSVEDDLALFAETLGPTEGLLLFAGGPGTRSVQVLDPEPRGDTLTTALAELFDPRGGRDARYRATRLALHGAATVTETLDAIGRALDEGAGPLTVFLAGHGGAGETPADATLLMWGDEALTPAALAETLDRAPRGRTVRVVVTSCYSGGFGELAFRGAKPALGPAEGRCGFFAAPWDLQASGCDPDPDRAVHEGYAIHFLSALRGRDREGREDRGALDLDRDGRISLREAHTRAVIASTSLDVPTTTSEVWLRAAAPTRGPERPVSLPEVEAVVRAMAERTQLGGREAQVGIELARRHARMERLDAESARREDDESGAWRAAMGVVLSRWPVLNDPWHPDFAATLADERDAIARFLDEAPEVVAWRRARARLDETTRLLDEARVAAAPYERLARAREDLVLARRLRAAGGEGWAGYERLLACERGAP